MSSPILASIVSIASAICLGDGSGVAPGGAGPAAGAAAGGAPVPNTNGKAPGVAVPAALAFAAAGPKGEVPDESEAIFTGERGAYAPTDLSFSPWPLGV